MGKEGLASMCNGTLLSLGKEQSNAICAAIWIDLEIISQNEVSQKRKKDKSNDITSMWNLNYDSNQLIYETNNLIDTDIKFMFTKGDRGCCCYCCC